MQSEMANGLKALQCDNVRLKKRIAAQDLEMDILKQAAKGTG